MHPELADAAAPFLLPHHQAMLDASAISKEVAEARGYRSIVDRKHLQAAGFSEAQSRMVPGLLIPTFTVTGEPGPPQFRPDNPPPGKDGKPGPKYLIAKGERLALDVHPLVRPHLRDANTPLWVTEGSRKADAAISAGLCCISLSGVTCWKDRQGTLQDWDEMAIKGRIIHIGFDSDTVFKPEVYAMLKRLKPTLERRSAIVKIAYLPPGPNGTKTGLDDYLARGGTTDGLLALCEDDLRPLEGDQDRAEVHALAQVILDRDYFAQDPGGSLYHYTEGVYRPGGEKYIRRRVKELLEEARCSDKWSSHKADEVIEYIRVDAPDLWPKPPGDTINLENGLLYVPKRTLLPHSPEHLSPIRIPVAYDPDAICPEWGRFIATTFPDDTQELPWELAAWLLTPNISIQKAVLLIGEGSNGKSTFLTALSAFLGKQNITALSLQKLEADKFALSRLIGKLANICADLPTAHLQEIAVFKALTGDEAQLNCEMKYRDSFEFEPYARLMFSANQPPRSTDATHAFFRRWLVVPFGRTFEEGTDRKPIPRHILDAQLHNPKELSGVLNRALSVLPRLQQVGFTETPSMRAAWTEFRQETDPLAVWLETATVADPQAIVTKKAIIEAYRTHCTDRGVQMPSATAFGLALKRLRPDIRDAQRTIEGHEKIWCWLGIALAPTPTGGPNNARNGSHSSRSSRGSTNCFGFETDENTSDEEGKGDNNRGNPVNPVNPVKPAPIVLHASRSQIDMARGLGLARKTANDRTRTTRQDRGSTTRNEVGDISGMLGEVCLAKFFDDNEVPYAWTPLATSAVSAPDFLKIWDTLTIEAKTARPNATDFYINEDQHQRFLKECPSVLYVPMLMQDETTFLVCRPVPIADVANWKLCIEADNPAFHDPCRQIPVTCLQPLTSIDQLRPKGGASDTRTWK